MKMPEGYLLLGEGPAGFDIEPPPGRARGDGHGGVSRATKLDERDTEGIVALAKGALALKRPDLDAALAQLFALDFARCDVKAVHAVDEMIWALIAVVNELCARPPGVLDIGPLIAGSPLRSLAKWRAPQATPLTLLPPKAESSEQSPLTCSASSKLGKNASASGNHARAARPSARHPRTSRQCRSKIRS